MSSWCKQSTSSGALESFLSNEASARLDGVDQRIIVSAEVADSRFVPAQLASRAWCTASLVTGGRLGDEAATA
jgi:hypothetical protein